MAENEKKTAPEAAKEAKPAKADKPSLWSRLTAWFRSVKSECKKVSWASWKAVQSNSIIVIVCVLIISAVVGILDYAFSGTLIGLSRIL